MIAVWPRKRFTPEELGERRAPLGSSKLPMLREILPAEMNRVRNEILPVFAELRAKGTFVVRMITVALEGAAKAIADDDVVAMLRWYSRLKAMTFFSITRTDDRMES